MVQLLSVFFVFLSVLLGLQDPRSGIEPVSLMSPALATGFFTTSTSWEALVFA